MDNCHMCGTKGFTTVLDYSICKWCSVNINHFIKSRVRNIMWGGGRIDRGNWIWVKKLINDYNIKSVLEFGTGLSTELLSLEGFEKMWSLDIHKGNIETMKKKVGGVHFIHYEFGQLPDLESENFDMVFVDGPQADRSRELSVANKIANKIIYCHDWGRNQSYDLLDPRWSSVIEKYRKWQGGEIGQHIFVDKEFPS